MLNPEMNKMMKNVGNRYLLVNLAAERAREIADEAEEQGISLPEKPVRIALDEIAEGIIVPDAEMAATRTESGDVF